MSDDTVTAYCVQWRSATMPAPAFWYYLDRSKAEHAASTFLKGEAEPPREVKVSRSTPFMDDPDFTR